MASVISTVDISQDESDQFDSLIKEYRRRYIRTPKTIVASVFESDAHLMKLISERNISKCIFDLRERIWEEYLKDEAVFNATLIKDLHKLLKTPDDILDILLKNNAVKVQEGEFNDSIKTLCGEYNGRVFSYMYKLSLSNTQSRRSRAGIGFEDVIYKIYESLGYEYASQSKVGRKIFESLGLGKKVDSILPGIECFKKRRNKTIIGTMKTSLRERWQEVAEEIERTKIPEIHLLTADDHIPANKAMEMANHNIIIVTYDWVANNEQLKQMRNIISFEKYFFQEIPDIIKFWDEN